MNGRRAAWILAAAAAIAGCGGSGNSTTGGGAGHGGSTGHPGTGGHGGAGGTTTTASDTGGSGGALPGAGPGPDAPKPSPGCGKAPQTGFYQAMTTMPVQGQPRAYWVAAPDMLPGDVPQKVVFVWHGCNGNVAGIRSGLSVEAAARAANDQAIFVYAQITTSGDPNATEGCFDGNVDAAYFLQVLADVENAYCLDENKVFTTGYSSGGIMSDLLGCFHADVLRAVIPVEGGLGSGQSSCPGKVDAFVIHSPHDEQIGWNQPATQTSHSWTDGRGEVPLHFFHDNDGCTAPAYDSKDATIGRVDYSCGTSGDGVHPYRVTRWLHDYAVPWQTDTPHHYFPPDAPQKIWDFIAATP